MVKPYTISMYEKYANGSSVKAGADILNGSFGVVNDGVFVNATHATHVVLQVGKGDENHTDFVIPSGADLRVFDLRDWVGKCLQVSPVHIKYGAGESYATITIGTMLTSNNDGQLVIDANAATEGNVYLKVVKKIEFDGEGLLCEICVA